MNKIATIKALKGYRSLIADQIMDCNESLDQLYKDAHSGNDIDKEWDLLINITNLIGHFKRSDFISVNYILNDLIVDKNIVNELKVILNLGIESDQLNSILSGYDDAEEFVEDFAERYTRYNHLSHIYRIQNKKIRLALQV